MTDSTPSTSSQVSAAHRLPYTVEPHRYDLRLAPDLESATFSGEVLITASAHEAVSEIVLNSTELTIESAKVSGPDGESATAVVSLQPDEERLTLQLPAP